MSKPFVFKQFTVHQDRCAMKIGTDGVLLGAWTSLKGMPDSILDIGAGTGVIALMLAQQSGASSIEGIEIDEAAYEQCVDNFENSPWGDRLFCYHAGLDELTEDIEEQYDLIVSNPPFHSEIVSSGNDSRDMARQNRSLPFEELILGVSQLLAENGSFSTIIPYKEEDAFLQLARQSNLYPKRITRVKGNLQSDIKRSLLELQFGETKAALNQLTIEEERHRYTQEYIDLTKDYYLKM